MARPRRPVSPGLLYHVSTRGVARQPVVRDDEDRERLWRALDALADRFAWQVRAACLMTNHLHLLVRTPEPDLPLGMQDLLGRYARAFNDRHDRTGHLFGDRYHHVLVRREEHHTELYRYLALNPVRAGLCTDPAAYRWSTHAALAGLDPPPPFLCFSGLEAAFGGDPARYAAFVADGTGDLLAALLGHGSPPRIRLALDSGYSQSAIARHLGVSRQTLYQRLRRAKS